MKPIIKNIIIVVLVVAVILAVYLYFTKFAKKDGAPLTSSLGSIASTTEIDTTPDTAFLSTLIGLTNIKIDSAVFTSKSFTALEDNTVSIGNPGTPGRSNPFAPIEILSMPEEIILPPSLDASQIGNTTQTNTTIPSNSTNNTNSILHRLLNQNKTN